MSIIEEYTSQNNINFFDIKQIDGTNEFDFFKYLIKLAIYISSKIDIRFMIKIVSPYLDSYNDYVLPTKILNIVSENGKISIEIFGELKVIEKTKKINIDNIFDSHFCVNNKNKKLYSHYIYYPTNSDEQIIISNKSIEDYYRNTIDSRMKILVNVLKPICKILDDIKFNLKQVKAIKGNDKESFNKELYAKIYKKEYIFTPLKDDPEKNIFKMNTVYFPAGLKINAFDDKNIPYFYYSILGITISMAIFVPDDFNSSYNNYALINYDTSKYYKCYAKAEHGGSTRLNTSIIEFLITGIPIDDEKDQLLDIKKRVLTLLSGFISVIDRKIEDRCIKCNDDIYVFHGSNNPIHSGDSFKILAFLSTTISWDIAYKYAKNKGFIYIIKIKKGFPFLHVNDYGNYQILLPIGTQLNIQPKKNNIEGTKIINCETSAFSEKIISDINQIFNTISSFPQLNLNEKYTHFLNISDFNNVHIVSMSKGSSVFHQGIYKNHKYYIKSITKRSNANRKSKGKYYIMKRIINELLANILYNFYDLQTFSYKIIVNDKNIHDMDSYCLSSKLKENINYNFPSTKDTSLKIMQSFIVDCILSNWDVGNNDNIGIFNNQIIHTDAGGALVYRGRGDVKIEYYYNYNQPNEHRIFIRNDSGTGKFFYKHMDMLKKYPDVDIDSVMYEIINKHDPDKIKLFQPILDLKSDLIKIGLGTHFCDFIDKIISIVIARHKFYIAKSKKIKTKKSNMKILFFENNKKYIIRNDKVGNQYFVKNKEKIFLSAIPNKWKFITDGGYTPIESYISTNGIPPSIFDNIISDRLKQIDRNYLKN